jgi:predicted esterase
VLTRRTAWLSSAILLITSACSRHADRAQAAQATPAEKAPGVTSAAAQRSLPEPPYTIAEPPMPPAELHGSDLSTAPVSAIEGSVRELSYERAYADAAILQRWLVARHVTGSMYNLACFESRAGHVEAAVYWLQRGAREDGMGVRLATEDPDLAQVRRDPRWPTVLSYLQATSTYWAQSGIERSNRVVPRGAPSATGYPLVVGLHGYGDSERFFGSDMQPLADETGTVFLSLSGTIPQGPATFEWAEDVVRDGARIERGLAQLGDVAVDAKHRVLMGFSQGAELAAAVLAKYPDRYAGAIVFSPGSFTGLEPQGSPEGTDWRSKSLVIRLGAGEHATTIASAEAVRDYFSRLGARVDYYAYPGQRTHSFPPDYVEKIARWVAYASGRAE